MENSGHLDLIPFNLKGNGNLRFLAVDWALLTGMAREVGAIIRLAISRTLTCTSSYFISCQVGKCIYNCICIHRYLYIIVTPRSHRAVMHDPP